MWPLITSERSVWHLTEGDAGTQSGLQARRAPHMSDPGDIEDWGAIEITERCCGAMTCRVLAPEIFHEARPGDATRVFTVVPNGGLKSKEEYMEVRRAIPACPFAAIRWTRRPRAELLPPEPLPDINEVYPQAIEDGVYFLGNFSPDNACATGYFVKRPMGNFLVDPCKPNPAILERVQKMGGAKYIIFTHQDHTRFHDGWHEALGAPRLVHAADVVHEDGGFMPRTDSFEVKLSGDKTQRLDPELKVVPVPGHTPGSVVILYKDTFLFTGDSMLYSRVEGHLVAPRLQCWTDWRQQTRSLHRLFSEKFLWVLPGHGEPRRFDTHEQAHESLRQGLQWMAQQPAGNTSLARFFGWITLRKRKSALWTWVADNVMLPYAAQRYIPLYHRRRFHPLFLAGLAVLLAALLRYRLRRTARRLLGA